MNGTYELINVIQFSKVHQLATTSIHLLSILKISLYSAP